MVNIKGLKKSQVLLALYDHSMSQGFGFFGVPGEPVTEEMLDELIKEKLKTGPELYFDYVLGRVIKCDITGDEFEPWLYDRDLGKGAAEEAIKQIDR